MWVGGMVEVSEGNKGERLKIQPQHEGALFPRLKFENKMLVAFLAGFLLTDIYSLAGAAILTSAAFAAARLEGIKRFLLKP